MPRSITSPNATQASLTPSIVQQALARDQGCIFSGHVPGGDSDPVVVTWIFPPFLGYEVSAHCPMTIMTGADILLSSQ